MKKKFTLLYFILLLSTAGFCQTWNGTVSSNWNTNTNWTPSTVPGPGSNVTINNGAAPNMPKLQNAVTINSLSLTAGTLDLNGFTLTNTAGATLSNSNLITGVTGKIFCSSASISGCTITGDFTLKADSNSNCPITNNLFKGVNNTITAGFFGGSNFTGNIFGQAGTGTTALNSLLTAAGSVDWYDGSNKYLNDLNMLIYAPNASGGNRYRNGYYGADSVFGNAAYKLSGNVAFYKASNATNNYVGGNLTLDADNGNPYINFNTNLKVGGSFFGQNFSSNHNTFNLNNLTVNGTSPTGNLQCGSGNVVGCSFNGNFTMLVDSNSNYPVTNNLFKGANNTITAGFFGGSNFTGNTFGQTGTGTTALNSLLTAAGSIDWYDGSNKYLNDLNMLIYAPNASAGNRYRNGYYGADSVLGNASYKLTGNVAFYKASNATNNYVGGNLTLDADNGGPYINFYNTLTVVGSFFGQNFSSNHNTFILNNLTVNGTSPTGNLQCGSGNVVGCSFNGNFTMLVDSNSNYPVTNNLFKGANNTITAGFFGGSNFTGNTFGQTGTGTTALNSLLVAAGSIDWYDGSNKYLNDLNMLIYAPTASAGNRYRNGYYGADSVLGNASYKLTGNVAFYKASNATNNYVGGNLTLDADNGTPYISFANTLTVGGSFFGQNFSSNHNTFILNNLTVNGTSPTGNLQCGSGNITTCIFNGNFTMLVDSNSNYPVTNNLFKGANNTITAGFFGSSGFTGNTFGKTGTGTTVLNSLLTATGSVDWYDGSDRYLNNLNLYIYSPLSSGGNRYHQAYYGIDSIGGNFLLTTGGNAVVSLADNQTIYVGDSLKFNNTGGGTINQNNTSTQIILNSTDSTGYSFAGTMPTLRNITLIKRGSITLLSPLTINNSLTLTRGIINTDLVNILTILNGVPVTGGGDSTYVAGPVRKIGNQAFIFPLGRVNKYAPLTITAPVNPTDEFRGNYIFDNPALNAFDTSLHDPTLHHVNGNEYWICDRLAGTSNVKVTLGWDSLRTGTIDNLPQLRVARWNGSTWKDEGNGATTGNNVVGSVQTANPVTSFSPFTLASTTVNNPFILTITWQGIFSDSWQGNTNWNVAKVPGLGNNVLINNAGAKFQPKLFSNVTINNMNMTAGKLDLNGLTLTANGVVNLQGDSLLAGKIIATDFADVKNMKITGKVTLQKTNATSNETWFGNNRVINDSLVVIWAGGTLTMANNASDNILSALKIVANGGIVNIGKTDLPVNNLSLNTIGTANINVGGPGNLFISGNLQTSNSGSGNITQTTGSLITFNGIDTGSYTGTGTMPVIKNIVMNKVGGIKFFSPLTVLNNVMFTRGIIKTDLTNVLTLPAGATVTAVWDSSYVDGAVTKIGNTAFDFPVGQISKYAPISITAPALITDAFRGFYSHTNATASGYPTTNHDPSLYLVTGIEYWLMDRTVGTSNVKVTLSYDSIRSGKVFNMPDLSVARWNGSTWKDEGNGGTTGTNKKGTVQTLNAITSFSPFTLATKTNLNPLPLTLVDFNASANSGSVVCKWQTTQEINTSHFVVQRSFDGRQFDNVGSKNAAGNSSVALAYQYDDINAALLGYNKLFYRLQIVNADGSFSYSSVSVVNLKSKVLFTISPNPAADYIRIQGINLVQAEVINNGGKTMIRKTFSGSSDNNINVARLSKGLYAVRMTDKNGDVQTERIVIQ